MAAGLPVILQDLDGNTYVYGLDLISVTDKDGNQTYFLYDGLGSTTGLADGGGNVTAGYGYDVFGAIRSQSGSSPNYWLFTGEQRDSESGLYYLRARYYDPDIGRFLGRDLLQLGSRYAYVGSNPVNRVDPTGLVAWIVGGGGGSPNKESGSFTWPPAWKPRYLICDAGGCRVSYVLPQNYICQFGPPNQPLPCGPAHFGGFSVSGSLSRLVGQALDVLTSECAQGIAKVTIGTAAAISAATGVGALVEAGGVVIVSASSAAVSATAAYYAAGPQNVEKVVTFLPGGAVQVYESCGP